MISKQSLLTIFIIKKKHLETKSTIAQKILWHYTQTWNPKSKSEPHAQSAVELMSLAKQTFDDLLEIPIEITEDLALDVAHGWDNLFQDYTAFVSSCGTYVNYIYIYYITTQNHQFIISSAQP